ncbi:MAG: hypothetical protein IPG76_05125, partial [Acidobacteria bacterium]|nr:hypothetical protein [Acidobacteriota bacterium]
MRKTFLAIVVLIIAPPPIFSSGRFRLKLVAWTPSPNPGSTGEFAGKSGFNSIENLVRDNGPGPEDVTMGSDGYFYTGYQDGRITRFKARRWRSGRVAVCSPSAEGPRHEDGCVQGNLVVCVDAFKGLISVAPDRKITVLVESVGGKR